MSNDDRDIMEMTDIAEKMRYRSQWMGTDAIVSALLSNGADEVDALRALVARQRAWIDGVAAQESTVSQYYDAIGRRHFTRLGETAEQIGYTCQPLITRPAPFESAP